MLSLYKCTPFEQWVEQICRKYRITTPEHLTIEYVSSRMNIWVYYQPFRSSHIDRGLGMYSVNVDARLSPEEQWEDFLHELCHVLRHSGNQFCMPESFLQWQEQDANSFVPYAAIPFFMLNRMELPPHQNDLIGLITHTFRVTRELARRRVEQIQRRILQTILHEEWLKQVALDERKLI